MADDVRIFVSRTSLRSSCDPYEYVMRPSRCEAWHMGGWNSCLVFDSIYFYGPELVSLHADVVGRKVVPR